MRVRTLWSLLFITFTVLFFQIMAGGILNAHEYDHKGNDKTSTIGLKKIGVVNLGMALTRTPELGRDYAALTLSNLDHTATGCIDVSDFKHEVSYESIYLNITLDGFEVDDENLPRYPHYECNAKPQDQKAEIILNLDHLQENGTKLVKITSGPAIEYFDLTLTDEKIELVTSESHKARVHYFKPKKIFGRKEALLLWRYPENTLALYMPGQVPDKPDMIKSAIYEIAEKHDLTPLEDIITDFKSPVTADGYYYFVDRSGKIADKFNGRGGGLLDNIKVKTNSYELEGDREVLKDAAVYAKKPGINE